MVRYMVDAIDPSQYTATVTVPGRGVRPVALRAGYVNGRWPTAITAHTEVSIDVNGGAPGADVLDIETGDATPDSAPGWVRAHNEQPGHDRAVLYCNRSVRPAVAAACSAAGLQAGRDFWWWIATLDGNDKDLNGALLADEPGVIAVQRWSANYFNTDIDLSEVYADDWKGTEPAPEERVMPYIVQTPDGSAYVVDFFGVQHIPDPPTLDSYKASGLPVAQISPDQLSLQIRDAGARYNGLLTDLSRWVLCRTPDDKTGAWLWDRIAGVDTKTGGIADILAAVKALQPSGTVDPAALAAALLADDAAVQKLGDAIAAGLASRVHNG